MNLSQIDFPAKAGDEVNFPSMGVSALTLAMDSKKAAAGWPARDRFAGRRCVANGFGVCSGVLTGKSDGNWVENLWLRGSLLPVLVFRLSFCWASGVMKNEAAA